MVEQRSKHPVFIVDDEKRLLESLYITLRTAGFENISTFSRGQEILDRLPHLDCRVLLLDLFMPGVSGRQILERICSQCPNVQVVVITGVNETDSAVRCIKAGAFDYLVKPVDPQRLVVTVRRALSHALLVSQNQRLRKKLLEGGLDSPETFKDIITIDTRMMSIFSYLEVIAPASDPVLITGETGTGKDLAASALHMASGRSGPFISLNSAGLDDNVFSDTLFGHVRGAYTDARESRKGLVEQAEGGTLFLDEIGDLSRASQVKLLKLIEDHEYYPLGSDIPRMSRSRIVAATNRDLEERQIQGLFRRDFFYRINTYHVHLPPLRERREDIALLAEHYQEMACKELGIQKETLSQEVVSLLKSYDFPGNIRELRSLIYSSIAQGGQGILRSRLAGLTCKAPGGQPEDEPATTSDSWRYPDPIPTLKQAVNRLIIQAMEKSNGNQAEAGRILGISRQALNRRLKKQ